MDRNTDERAIKTETYTRAGIKKEKEGNTMGFRTAASPLRAPCLCITLSRCLFPLFQPTRKWPPVQMKVCVWKRLGVLLQGAHYKGHEVNSACRPENVENGQNISSWTVVRLLYLCLCDTSTFQSCALVLLQSTWQKYSFLWHLRSSRRGRIGSLFTSGQQKSLVHGVLDTSATHADLVSEVTDTDCQTHNGSAHGGVLATFNCWFLT